MSRILKKAAALLLCISALLLCSCAWLGDLLYDASTDGEPEPVPTEPAPAETGESPSAAAGNPVFGFFISYMRLFEKQTYGSFDAVYSSGDMELIASYLDFMRDEARLAEICATVGMLPASTETVEPYYGILTGAYAGEGSIDRESAFSFRFENGGSISGELIGGTKIVFTKTAGRSVSRLSLSRTGRGYTARIDAEGITSYIEISRNGLRYTRFPSIPGDEPAGEISFPENPSSKVLTYSGGRASLSE